MFCFGQLSTINCDLVFVYGSLRRGFEAQGLMHRVGSRYLGKARVRGKLYNLGEFLGAVKAPRSSVRVRGELYYLPSAARALKCLDRYEGSQYRREVTEVELRGAGRKHAWIYWLKAGTDGSVKVKG